MSIPTFSSTEFLHVYVFFLVALNLEWLLALFWATCIKNNKNEAEDKCELIRPITYTLHLSLLIRVKELSKVNC